MAMRGGRLETEPVFEPIEEFLCRYFGDADGSVALHVGMTSDGTQSGAWTTNIAAQQKQVGKLLHGLGSVAVLGDTHAVYQDGIVGLYVHVRGFGDFGAAEAGVAGNVFPVRRLHIGNECLKADGVAADEVVV